MGKEYQNVDIALANFTEASAVFNSRAAKGATPLTPEIKDEYAKFAQLDFSNSF